MKLMPVTNKPYAQSCEENKAVILHELDTVFSASKKVLEIGSGTGQHAVHFAKGLPHLNWQPTELPENIRGIELWLQEAKLNNISLPKCLDVEQTDWLLEERFDAAFTANTLHIISILHVEKLFSGLSNVLITGAKFCSYGPFNRKGQFTSESNARFDLWLKQRDPVSGIRDMADLLKIANAVNLELVDDIEMPTNNRLLVWSKVSK